MAITTIIKEKRPIGVNPFALSTGEQNKRESMMAEGKIIFQQEITLETSATHVIVLKITDFKDEAAKEEWIAAIDLTARQTYLTGNNIVQTFFSQINS
jgi:hypothetical protein